MFSGDQRFTVNQPSPDEWNLKIEYATQKDSGTYECQVNTEPKIKLSVVLEVTGEDEKRKRKVSSFVCSFHSFPSLLHSNPRAQFFVEFTFEKKFTVLLSRSLIKFSRQLQFQKFFKNEFSPPPIVLMEKVRLFAAFSWERRKKKIIYFHLLSSQRATGNL